MDIRVVDYLRSISRIWDKGAELIIHCPYCDDAKRPRANSHGHCYISKQKGVFHCFRCDTSGSIVRLLIDTGFSDEEVIGELKRLMPGETYRTLGRNRSNDTTNQMIESATAEFKSKYYQQYELFRRYIYSRIGVVDHKQFYIVPFLDDDELACMFYNYDGVKVCRRIIRNNPLKLRYKTITNNSLYYFQSWSSIHDFKSVTIAEGVFDIINLYLYHRNDSFFVAMGGKRYTSTIEKLIISDLLVGRYEINVVFDADVNTGRFIKSINRLISQMNDSISVYYYIPRVGKDCSDFPELSRI